MPGGPLAELGATGGAHPVAHSQDHVQVVEQGLAPDLPIAFGLNCQGFLDSCRLLQLSLLQDVFDMKADILLGGVEQLCLAIVGVVEDKFGVSHAQPRGESECQFSPEFLLTPHLSPCSRPQSLPVPQQSPQWVDRFQHPTYGCNGSVRCYSRSF